MFERGRGGCTVVVSVAAAVFSSDLVLLWVICSTYVSVFFPTPYSFRFHMGVGERRVGDMSGRSVGGE